MIQRIQTLWLLVAAFAVFITLKFPFYSGTDSVEMTFKTLTGTSNLLILILTSALGACILVTIFLYRQRKLQARLVWLCMLVEVLIIYMYYRQIAGFNEGGVSFWIILHPVILVALFLAARGIHKDAKLIKESDRLR